LIDSDYDEFHVTLRFEARPGQYATGLTIHLFDEDADQQFGRVEIDLPLRVKGAIKKFFMVGIVSGIAMCAPVLASAYADDKLKAGVALAAIVAGLVGGLATSITAKSLSE
jgi:hypothetical protein